MTRRRSCGVDRGGGTRVASVQTGEAASWEGAARKWWLDKTRARGRVASCDTLGALAAARPGSCAGQGGALQLRGGAGLKRGVVINFLNGEKVDVSDMDDVDSNDDMTGAKPVDWLPRGDLILPHERELHALQLDPGNGEGESGGLGVNAAGLGGGQAGEARRTLLEDAYVRVQRVARAALQLWEQSAPGEKDGPAHHRHHHHGHHHAHGHRHASPRRGGAVGEGGGEGGGVVTRLWSVGALTLLGCVGGGGEAGVEADSDSESEDETSDETSSLSEDCITSWSEGPEKELGPALDSRELGPVLDKRVVCQAIQRLRCVAEDADAEGRPEVDSLLRQASWSG
ncbi:hypothetical protein T484DRAFT_1830443 [Baffinella frigidus]|nr:hypothetical protein T484DRAFT_1830443 [Cryptophyta sp. CCMP2293]